MTYTREELEKEAKKLWAVKTWKEQLIIGAVALGLVILLNTGLVEVTISVLKLVLFIVAVVYLVRAAYTSYPLWKKKLDM